MTIKDAIFVLNCVEAHGICIEAKKMAIQSLEAWEIIKDNLSQQIHHNLDIKENFEIGSTSRIECNTTASVLAGVIYLIDRHLSEVENADSN